MAKIPSETVNNIMKDLCKKDLMQKDIATAYGVSPAFVSRLKESSEKVDLNTERIIKKGSGYKIRVTAYIKGSLKNNFIKDCLDKGMNEVQMSKHIFETYYFIQSSIHNFDKIEPNKIKDYLKARIKL